MALSLSDFLSEHGELGRAEHLARFPSPVLFSAQSESGEPLTSAEQSSVVRSKVRRLTKDMLRTPLDTRAFILPDRSPVFGRLWFVTNKAGNERRNFIGVGRDPSCDLEFPEEEVSPRHGFFSVGETQTYTDAGSQHGSVVNGEPLAKMEPRNLRNHDLFELGGGPVLTFFTANGFYEFAKACAFALSKS